MGYLIVEEPMTGVHLHRAVAMNDIIGVERILETGYYFYLHTKNLFDWDICPFDTVMFSDQNPEPLY